MEKHRHFISQNDTTADSLHHLIQELSETEAVSAVQELKKSQKVNVLFNIAKLYPRDQPCHDTCMGVVLYHRLVKTTELILKTTELRRCLHAAVTSRMYMYLWLTASFLTNYSKYRHTVFTDNDSGVHVLNSVSIICLAILHSTAQTPIKQPLLTVEQLYYWYQKCGGVVSQSESIADNWLFIQYVCTHDLVNRQLYCTWFDTLAMMFMHVPHFGNVYNCMTWDRKKTDISKLLKTNSDVEAPSTNLLIQHSRETTFNLSRDLLLSVQNDAVLVQLRQSDVAAAAVILTTLLTGQWDATEKLKHTNVDIFVPRIKLLNFSTLDFMDVSYTEICHICIYTMTLTGYELFLVDIKDANNITPETLEEFFSVC